MNKLRELNELIFLRNKWRSEGKRVVFTNGCFDLIHSGHIELLTSAKAQGELLIVGLNSDSSVRKIKDKGRPIVDETNRVIVLSALEMIDYIVLFEETTPEKLISALLPDVLVKGSDWAISEVVGREEVEKNGGKVMLVDLLKGFSTSNIIKNIISNYCPPDNEHEEAAD
ncbi:D-glycero-beta-D-manno-heptose 1-phosphate adenylyltransferase [bacterium]|nr:D-glycero-beta-D-manno-heptose 1-phosphate adenylyltransferase [bacterium]